MSDADYEKECLFCKNKILMSKRSKSWLPYELNSDKKHECRNKDKQVIQEVISRIKPKQEPTTREAKLAHVLEMIQFVVKELEALK